MNQSSSSSSSSSEPTTMSNWLNWFSLNSKCWPIQVAISILISTGCLCVMVFKYRKERSKPKDTRILMRSSSIGLLHGGKLAMQRLLDSHNALANMAILSEADETRFQDLLDQKTHDFKKLQV
ncbi:hypothetical protein BVC80_8179g2 [Macleaya cordata]|uniref:Transmembrane protein n=1 Tax=Macleaya cordata TaxID=56857 RepID=A0A200QSP5_MACCD|nr:hypothetical protein BVC80_8179g2 [Macleaya cordata]